MEDAYTYFGNGRGTTGLAPRSPTTTTAPLPRSAPPRRLRPPRTRTHTNADVHTRAKATPSPAAVRVRARHAPSGARALHPKSLLAYLQSTYVHIFALLFTVTNHCTSDTGYFFCTVWNTAYIVFVQRFPRIGLGKFAFFMRVTFQCRKSLHGWNDRIFHSLLIFVEYSIRNLNWIKSFTI